MRFTFAWAADGLDHFELFRTLDLSASGLLLTRHVAGSAMPRLGVVGECAFNIDSTEIRSQALVVRSTDEAYAVRLVSLPRHLEDKIVAWVFRIEAHRVSRRLT